MSGVALYFVLDWSIERYSGEVVHGVRLAKLVSGGCEARPGDFQVLGLTLPMWVASYWHPFLLIASVSICAAALWLFSSRRSLTTT